MLERLKNKYKQYRKLKKLRREVRDWEARGRPNPPPHLIKQRELLGYAERYELKIFIETGTFKGDMVEAMKGRFDSVISIELSDDLFNRAKNKFRDDSNVMLVCGDSGVELKRIVKGLAAPALFWLDGHYSGGSTAKGNLETPIKEELRTILQDENKHVILIDDARCFGVDPDYPTLNELYEFIRSYDPDVAIDVRFDSIRIVR